VSNSSVEIIVNLAYTGGGDITHVNVSFREIGTIEWIMKGDQHANSMSEMTWKALVEDDRFIGIAVEFQVAVKNDNGHYSVAVTRNEPLGKMLMNGKGSSQNLLVGNGRFSYQLHIQLQRGMFTLWYVNQCNHSFSVTRLTV
jgi:hypothetical protein